MKPLISDSYSIANGIKAAGHRSYRNFFQAARMLQGKEHDPFGTPKVKATSVSYTKKIEQETGMTLAQIERWAASRMR